MVHRIFVRKGTDTALLKEIREFLQINLEDLVIYIRYDIDHISDDLFTKSLTTVFSTIQTDTLHNEITEKGTIFALEYLPGQFDQRADSAAQCVQLLGLCKRPEIRCATVYLLKGQLSSQAVATIRSYLLNPVEAREADLGKVSSLDVNYPIPPDISSIEGFNELDKEGLQALGSSKGLAMDEEDLALFQQYFKDKGRQPSETELRVVDTYWSDHCRHTTFSTVIKEAKIADTNVKETYGHYLELRQKKGRKKPVTLMDIATSGPRYITVRGLDASEEINACTVKTTVKVNGESVPYLLLFKNETHNHPTEIEPFGGAATCIGGAIRDPLSGRAYVYQAMRIAGCGNPLEKVEDTMKGKLPQRKLARTAAAGNSSYGNQVGLATGLVDEIYHDGYKAKHMELGAVIGAVPQENVIRERPQAEDVVLLIGGRTGRDGCGGATGSSKSHDTSSLSACGSEVQKGNAPEERKLQRLFRNKEASRMIKRCNDFGAGGVSVAIGELAPGLEIDLDKVPTKYAGLDGTELAISESQERMAVVVAPQDAARFMELADQENIEATIVAKVTERPTLVMYHRTRKIVDIDRAFLDTNGAAKSCTVEVPEEADSTGYPEEYQQKDLHERCRQLFASLDCCSRQGCSERFDATIGTATVLMPYGGIYQKSPEQSMVAQFPVEGKTTDCTVMSYGFDPVTMEHTPYKGAYASVVSSVCKNIASGGRLDHMYLTLQEYFGRTDTEPKRWGKPFAALLGSLQAQLDLGIAAIGGKDSMSGTFNELDVPNTLVSFAVSTTKNGCVIPSCFSKVGSPLVLFTPDRKHLRSSLSKAEALIHGKKAYASFALGRHGLAEALCKMSFGNRIGCEIREGVNLFSASLGQIILECKHSSVPEGECFTVIGRTIRAYRLIQGTESVDLSEIEAVSDSVLEPVYPRKANQEQTAAVRHIQGIRREPLKGKTYARPVFLLPVFPGTNCEYDSCKAIGRAGGTAETFVINNQSAERVMESAKQFAKRLHEAQVLFIPGGFSGGDEPDGSGKFISNFLRSPYISEEIDRLLNDRGGLILGICNGFQALIKLGLVPYGRITEIKADDPTLTYNTIGRHQSRLVRTRICTNASPWLSQFEIGEITMAPISHGEGRFVCDPDHLERLIKAGQIGTQYCDIKGNPSMDIETNPNGSTEAIESLLSPDGRVLGKMAHNERCCKGLYKNTPAKQDDRLFLGAIRYFS
ncbi:MAG: phosphoribosylformylglycinamidine synthase [Spirochaetia bacterium]|nr:phosphoribosylformylglycinamidine synthase [Spirochaetia bacterium]